MQKCVNKKCPAYNTDYVYNCEMNAIIADGNCKEYQPDAPQEIAAENQHIPKHTQHKICPSCGQTLCIGEREECRCWCCEASWAAGKIRASA